MSREFISAENWFEETLASHRICTYKFGVYVYRSLAERYGAECNVPTLRLVGNSQTLFKSWRYADDK